MDTKGTFAKKQETGPFCDTKVQVGVVQLDRCQIVSISYSDCKLLNENMYVQSLSQTVYILPHSMLKEGKSFRFAQEKPDNKLKESKIAPHVE